MIADLPEYAAPHMARVRLVRELTRLQPATMQQIMDDHYAREAYEASIAEIPATPGRTTFNRPVATAQDSPISWRRSAGTPPLEPADRTPLRGLPRLGKRPSWRRLSEAERGPPRFVPGRPGFGTGFQRRSLNGWVPLKPHLGVSCFWRLLIFVKWPRRTPLSRAENPPIAFICELKKQVRIGLVLLGEGQSAISDRAGAAHGISNPNATERGFKYRKRFGSGPSAGALCDRRDRLASL
jgi:hypothetical protein